MTVGWKVATAVAAVSALAVGGAVATSAIAENSEPATAEPAPDKCLSQTEAEFLKLINDYRAEQGVGPLKASQALNVASHRHSDDMAANDYFDHDSPDGRSPQDRMAEAGYDTDTSTGENIAAGYPTAEEVFETWRESDGHNENMLDPDYQVIGIGLVSREDSEYTEYWTTDFGGKVDAAPECEAAPDKPAPDKPAPDKPAPGKCLSAKEAQFLKLINDYRARHDLPRLKASKTLNVASYRHSKDMSENDYFDHTSRDGREPHDRMRDAGYDIDTSTGENIAYGYGTAKSVFTAWRESPGHNKNMLNRKYKVIGVGLFERGDYWTTDFGGKRAPAPNCG